METTNLLFVGDVHLGRRPGRVPPDLAVGMDPRAAFKAVVEEAVSRRVRAVVFLGDVVDSEDHFLEAYSTLERGLTRLIQAGIEVLAVVGNHDVRVLPRLAAEVPGFRLLGRDGRWEEHVLEGDGGVPLVRLVAWSFPRAQVHRSPLDNLDDLGLAPRTDVPTIGILHADLDGGRSPYAPVARADLAAVATVDAWLLGHVHLPSREGLQGDRPLGYLGSLVGLDPTETGVHGPWEVTVRPGRDLHLAQVPLAPLAWEEVDVPVEDLAGAEDLDAALTAALRDFADRRGDEFGSARVVGVRQRLVGSSAHHREMALRARGLDVATLRIERGGRWYFVDRLRDAARPALDLEALARREDPPGLLARKVLALEADGEEGRDLVRAAGERVRRHLEVHPWGRLETPVPDAAEIRDRLRRAGERALEELLAAGDDTP